MRLKFRRSIKLVRHVNEGTVWGFPSPTYFTLSIHNGHDCGYTKSLRPGEKLRVPKRVTSALTPAERELVDHIRIHVRNWRVEGC